MGEWGRLLIQTYIYAPHTVFLLQLQHASQQSEATYDSISITPAAGTRQDAVHACMFTLQHVDCVGIDMHWASACRL